MCKLLLYIFKELFVRVLRSFWGWKKRGLAGVGQVVDSEAETPPLRGQKTDRGVEALL